MNDQSETKLAPTLPDASTLKVHRVQFHATASEYFRIWIVNLALTVITLGIYSAWAKVRTRKYIDGNIEIAGARFDYHADPVRILIGRIIIGTLFLGYSLGGRLSPAVSITCLVLFGLLFPWILVRGLMFASTNTSYRGIRFGFQKDYAGSYKAYAKGVFATLFTLGLGAPYAAWLHTKFRLNCTRFGQVLATFHASTQEFFKIYYLGYLHLLIGLPFAVLFFGIGAGVKRMMGEGSSRAVIMPFVAIGIVFLYGGILYGAAYIRSKTLNLVANRTQIGPVRFFSDMKPSALAWIYVTNILTCMLSLGLMIPWAVIRTLKYRFDHTQVHAAEGALELFGAHSTAGNTNAAADATVDFWDIDLGF